MMAFTYDTDIIDSFWARPEPQENTQELDDAELGLYQQDEDMDMYETRTALDGDTDEVRFLPYI
jgi:hypothetical protein